MVGLNGPMELQCSGCVAVHGIRLAYASMSGGHIKPVALTRPLLSPRLNVPQLSLVNRPHASLLVAHRISDLYTPCLPRSAASSTATATPTAPPPPCG